MGRAGGLAGRGAGLPAVDLVVVPVIGIPAVLAPGQIVREVVELVFHLCAVGLAELLTELCGTGGADLHALAAGHALVLVHVGAVGRAGHVRRVEKLRRAQTVAGAGRAVADADDAVRAVQICDLVDVALALGPLDDLHRLFARDVVGVLARGDQELGDVAHADAHLALDIAHALAADALGLAAGADHGAEGVVLLQPVGQVLHTDGGGAGVDRLLHGDHVHTDSRAAGRDQLGGQLQGLLGGQVEHRGDLGMLVGQGGVLHHVLARAHDPLRDQILDVVIRVVPVLLQNADPEQMVDDLLGRFLGHVVALGQLLRRQREAALFEAEHEFDLILGQHPVQDPEVHVVGFHSAGRLAGNVVGDQHRQLFDQLFFFGIDAMIVLKREIPLVDVDLRVNVSWHCQSLRFRMNHSVRLIIIAYRLKLFNCFPTSPRIFRAKKAKRDGCIPVRYTAVRDYKRRVQIDGAYLPIALVMRARASSSSS